MRGVFKMKKERAIGRAIVASCRREIDWGKVYIWLVLVAGSLYFGIGFLVKLARFGLL